MRLRRIMPFAAAAALIVLSGFVVLYGFGAVVKGIAAEQAFIGR
jgi:hypothetical protein